MKHTDECQRQALKAEVRIQQWQLVWPNYCRKCDGNGAFHYPGVWRYPDGSGEPPSDDPCEACTFEGKCARCGELGLALGTSEGPCAMCGWNYDDALPEPHECWGDCTEVQP